MTLRVRTAPLDDRRPLLDLVPEGDPVAWLHDRGGFVAWGSAVRIEPGPGPERFAAADAALRSLDAEVEDLVRQPGTGIIGLGSFTFDAAARGSVLVVPRVVVGRRDATTWLTTIDPAEAPPVAAPATVPRPAPARDRPRYAGSSKPDLHWLEAVAAAVERIRGGALDKVVLARDHAVWSREPFDAVDLARRLHQRFPGCYTFVVDNLVGATPELLLAKVGDEVRSHALAGTAARGPDPASDAALADSLFASDKDRREHAYAAASVHDVLARWCPGTLARDAEPVLVRLDNVQHLGTSFHGQLAAPATSLEIVADLHPTAAVGGSPTAPALALIRELEGMDRGRYAGPVGWTSPSGDGEWAIALRCAELAGARARLFAGGGIVRESLPEAELEETRLKLRAMQAALGAAID